jgi:predicted RNA-binding protein
LTIHEAKITHFLIIRSVIEEDIIKRETGIRKNDQFSGYLYSLNQLKNTKKDIDNYALLYPEEFL